MVTVDGMAGAPENRQTMFLNRVPRGGVPCGAMERELEGQVEDSGWISPVEFIESQK